MGKLELRWDGDGPRNFLAGKPLHAGEVLEVALSDGSWTSARYEHQWNPRTNELSAYFVIPHAELPGEESVLPAESTLCRWGR